jgi:hypothetical protein
MLRSEGRRKSQDVAMRIFVSVVLVAAFLGAQAPKHKPPPPDAAAGFQSINPEDCRKWLSVLASDDFEGRESGTAGFQKAADMVAAHFRELGLKPVGDHDAEGRPTYFQNVPFVAAALDGERARFEWGDAKDQVLVRVGEGFGATGLGSVAAKGPIVFVIAQAGPQKFPDFDVRGKIVIAVAYGPDGGLARAQGGMMADLRKSGAAAVVRVDDVVAARGVASTTPVRKDQFRPSPEKTPTVSISTAVAQAIAAANDKSLESMIAKSKSAGVPQSVPTKATAKIDLETKVVDMAVPNVAGYLEGSDPSLKNELVIIGSHLDHLGRDATGKVFNGADDDGSGTTGVLAVSRAFAKNSRAPRRSVLFLTFCGEEKGLLGSDWYVQHPIFPNENVIAELQMDMIGRREEAHEGENPGNETAEQNVNSLHVIGAKKIAPALNELIVKVNGEYTGFDFEYDQEGVYYRSDHYNFAKKGIPIAFFFTGFHRDYHQTTDDVEKIDFPKLARVAQLVYLTGWELAERPNRLPVDRKRPKDDR